VRKRLYPCMLCEKLYAEIEEAEVCELSHAIPEREREKYEDDGLEYADPRDFRDGLE
jgi:hypothetical protein